MAGEKYHSVSWPNISVNEITFPPGTIDLKNIIFYWRWTKSLFIHIFLASHSVPDKSTLWEVCSITEKKKYFNTSEGKDILFLVRGSQKEGIPIFLSSDLNVRIWELIAGEYIMGVAF